MTAVESIPVIDIASWISGDTGTERAIADHVDAACRGIGFFLVTGHSVSEGIQRTLYDEARRFFDLPDSVKSLARDAGDEMGGLVFLPLEREALAGTQGVIGPGDYKESLNYGAGLPGGRWPAGSAALREAFITYFAAMEALSKTMREIFCLAIGLPRDCFEEDFAGHLSALRVINYPEQPQPLAEGQVRAGAHTDYGFLTILRSEDTPGGLQVQGRGGSWIDVPAVEGAFIINIGDAFMRWTNGVWRSTPHRVVNPPAKAGRGSRRQSIPFFLNPRADTVINCLEPFLGEGGKALCPPIMYGDYIALKTRQANG